jgi:hypothetical protein
MKAADPRLFHNLYGPKRPRISFKKGDFIDYVLMTLLSASAIYLSYGPFSAMSLIGLVLCVVMMAAFIFRHGVELSVPLIARRPQDILYMVVYKFQNMTGAYLFALGTLILENVLIYLTPTWPHHVSLMRTIALYLFYFHFIALTAYRTAILIAHLRKREHIREVMSQTTWRRFLRKQPNVSLEILHAYVTGVLTHMVLLIPWFVVINYCKFSIIFLPLICVINYITQVKYFKVHNAWFYRDHWLGHNSELEFVYLHGTHHDALPCGLIGVAGNGHLEGLLRHVLAFPTQFFNPVMAFVVFTLIVVADITSHQYVPGVYPRLTRGFHSVAQHSTHHFGRLEPYSFGLNVDRPGISDAVKRLFKLPSELRNSIELDVELTGFQWDNPSYRRYLGLVERYQK